MVRWKLLEMCSPTYSGGPPTWGKPSFRDLQYCQNDHFSPAYVIPGTHIPLCHLSTRFGGTDFCSAAERFGTPVDNLAEVLLYLLLSTLLPLEDRGTSWKKSLQKKEHIVGVVPNGTHPMYIWVGWGWPKKKRKEKKIMDQNLQR